MVIYIKGNKHKSRKSLNDLKNGQEAISFDASFFLFQLKQKIGATVFHNNICIYILYILKAYQAGTSNKNKRCNTIARLVPVPSACLLRS